MITAGYVSKTREEQGFVYTIGDVKVVSKIEIPELERQLQRPIVLTTVEGFSIAQSVKRLRKEIRS